MRDPSLYDPSKENVMMRCLGTYQSVMSSAHRAGTILGQFWPTTRLGQCQQWVLKGVPNRETASNLPRRWEVPQEGEKKSPNGT